MKKMFISVTIIAGVVIGSLFFVENVTAKRTSNIKQTICFSQNLSDVKFGSRHIGVATLGDNVTLNGGECNGRTLPQMNQAGWRLIQVVTGLQEAFGMVLEKE